MDMTVTGTPLLWRGDGWSHSEFTLGHALEGKPPGHTASLVWNVKETEKLMTALWPFIEMEKV